MTIREWLEESKSAGFIAIAVVLCAVSFGFGTNYSHSNSVAPKSVAHSALPGCPNEDPGPKHSDCYGGSTVYGDGGGTPFILHDGIRYIQLSDDCEGMPIPNPCDPDSNN